MPIRGPALVRAWVRRAPRRDGAAAVEPTQVASVAMPIRLTVAQPNRRSPRTLAIPRLERISTGQAVVEFALVIPIALLLMLGIGDFARVYTTAITVESAAREAADFGGFQASNWLSANVTITTAEMQRRACTAASTLPDYRSANPNNTCTNPTITYVLENPSDIDCSQAVPAGKLPCAVHVKAHYDFGLFLGGSGIQGLFTLPVTVPIDRDVSYVVNDFPSP